MGDGCIIITDDGGCIQDDAKKLRGVSNSVSEKAAEKNRRLREDKMMNDRYDEKAKTMRPTAGVT